MQFVPLKLPVVWSLIIIQIENVTYEIVTHTQETYLSYFILFSKSTVYSKAAAFGLNISLHRNKFSVYTIETRPFCGNTGSDE